MYVTKWEQGTFGIHIFLCGILPLTILCKLSMTTVGLTMFSVPIVALKFPKFSYGI
jgi:hypothetical protein